MSASDFTDKEDVFDLTLKQAIGVLKKKDEDFILSSKLNKVTQLTGFSDPVYAEAYVHVNQYDIVLDVLVVNQTSDTLQSLTLELATLGDLKLVEKPQALTLAQRDFTNIKTNMKCLTPEKALSGECGFMAANLYAKSIFGEDVLANVSIEKSLQNPDSQVHGHIRIRAKSQGMALSMGKTFIYFI